MTSWGGTSMTTVRRSTRTICCAAGKTRKMPGPLTAVNRPKVKITPRSYSFSTLKELVTSSAATTTMMMRPIPISASLSRRMFSGFHYKLEAGALHHAHGCTFVQSSGALRIPEFAVHPHLAAPGGIEGVQHGADG